MNFPKKVGILTAGGLAPCLSAAVGYLIQKYTKASPDTEIICYKSGYKGLLLGDSIGVSSFVREKASLLLKYGGSPIGNSRVKLTNVEDCIKRGLIKQGEDPEEVAINQLLSDKIDVLHTIGGDDTNTAAATLASKLQGKGHSLTVIGLPKTVDNDVIPIVQTLGAWTAADQGARFFENVASESTANPRMLIIHEVMGRHCGWLTAATARLYTERLEEKNFLPEIGLSRVSRQIDGLYLPEMDFDIEAEATRLKCALDKNDSVNLFVSEGAGVDAIVKQMESSGESVPRDAFGHVKLDAVNPGQWFGKKFASMIRAEKVLVQKSGYFARSAPANPKDLALIEQSAELAVESAFEGKSGVVGQDQEKDGAWSVIDFSRIQGGGAFDLHTPWFLDLLSKIGQKVVTKSL